MLQESVLRLLTKPLQSKLSSGVFVSSKNLIHQNQRFLSTVSPGLLGIGQVNE